MIGATILLSIQDLRVLPVGVSFFDSLKGPAAEWLPVLSFRVLSPRSFLPAQSLKTFRLPALPFPLFPLPPSLPSRPTTLCVVGRLGFYLDGQRLTAAARPNKSAYKTQLPKRKIRNKTQKEWMRSIGKNKFKQTLSQQRSGRAESVFIKHAAFRPINKNRRQNPRRRAILARRRGFWRIRAARRQAQRQSTRRKRRPALRKRNAAARFCSAERSSSRCLQPFFIYGIRAAAASELATMRRRFRRGRRTRRRPSACKERRGRRIRR